MTIIDKECEMVINEALQNIANREYQMIAEGCVWPFDARPYRYGLEQAIINRKSNETMQLAATRYVESIEFQAESFNGI